MLQQPDIFSVICTCDENIQFGAVIQSQVPNIQHCSVSYHTAPFFNHTIYVVAHINSATKKGKEEI